MENIFFHYAAAEGLYTAMVNPVCEKHGLTYMEFTVLMFLANNPRFDTASDIIKYRRLTKSHVSLSIHSLMDKGLLRGEHRGENRKTIHLMVLEAANAIVSDGREAQRSFGNILFSGFSDSEYQELTSFMMRIDKNINDHIE
ncbi:MAG: MarR family winged helix-turn-helix transcriptional regulator, partial [Bacillota bacterium]|nr:MarR family winged helix-turn-helix transcriptional regulator [Bacillota bacterium]